VKQGNDEDSAVLRSLGYTQELDRRLGVFSNFSISFSIICVLVAGTATFSLALSTGGGWEAVWGWVIGSLFALVVAASLSQIASSYPTAGGLYHWSSLLGGRFWGWLTAWVNLLGLIFGFAACNVAVYNLVRTLIVGPLFHVDTSSWGMTEQTIAVAGMAATQAAINHFGIRLTATLTAFSGYLIFVATVVLTATFLIWGATFDFSRLMTFVNNTGAPGGNYIPQARSSWVAFLIGLLYPIYTSTGFDASAHVAEETVNARSAVPRAILYAVLWSTVVGFFMTVAFVMASPDLAATAKDGPDAWFNLFNRLPAPALLKQALAVAMVIASYLCALAALTSLSRMTYSFARDGGLPASSLLRRVSSVWRTPVAAIWVGAALSLATTLYSGAFAALAAGTSLFLYLSYAMPVVAGLLAENRTWTDFGPFRLGVLSKPFAVITGVGVGVVLYAGLQPPFDVLQNYLLGLALILLAFWFGLERRRFQGPPNVAPLRARRLDVQQPGPQ
jgi:amino acid transporter